MGETKTHTYDNFRGGEWGELGGEKAPAGSFHGVNVMVYADGFLGPRPGLKNVTPDGMIEGLLRFLVESPTPDREAVFGVGVEAYYSSYRDFSIDPTIFTGDDITGFGFAILPKPDGPTFLVAVADVVAGDSSGGVYRIDQTDGTVEKLNDAPPGDEHEQWTQQLIVNDQRGDGPRIFGSVPGDFEDWPSENFLDVGDIYWGVRAMRKQGNFLVIFKRNSIHLLSGVFGDDTMVVRDVYWNANGVVDAPWHVTVDSDGRIWYIPLFRENIASFASSSVNQLGHLTGLSPRSNEDDNLPVKRGITAFEGQLDSSTIIAVQGDGDDLGIVRHNGVWTYHHFEAPISGMLNGFGNHYTITDGGAEGEAANIYMGVFDLDRPAFTDDDHASPGDGSNTPLETAVALPIWLNREGHDVRVRSVTVEIKKWDTGVETNELACIVKTINRPNGAGDVINAEREWSEDASVSSTSGDHDRLVFPMHCAIGQGYQIMFENLVGVAVKSYTVELESFDTPRKS